MNIAPGELVILIKEGKFPIRLRTHPEQSLVGFVKPTIVETGTLALYIGLHCTVEEHLKGFSNMIKNVQVTYFFVLVNGIPGWVKSTECGMIRP